MSFRKHSIVIVGALVIPLIAVPLWLTSRPGGSTVSLSQPQPFLEPSTRSTPSDGSPSPVSPGVTAAGTPISRPHPVGASPTRKPTPSPQPSATPTPQPTPSSMPSPTTTPSPSTAPTPTPTPTPPPTPTPTPSPSPLGPPAFSHVFVIVMENKEYGAVIGNPSAPYINKLANTYGLATSYYAVSHPSLPNYLALTGGGTFGVTSDCTGCFIAATNIADQIEAHGHTWKAYMESMPSPCFVGDAYPYVQKHDPFIYYNDIRTNLTRCRSHVVPFSQFSQDLTSGNVPNYAWITPNMCNDMHDCSVASGDAWLARTIPTITNSSAFQNGGALFLIWDEGTTNAGCCTDAAGGHVASLVISPLGKARFSSATPATHYSLLRTIEDAWGLPRLGGASCACTGAMQEYFK